MLLWNKSCSDFRSLGYWLHFLMQDLTPSMYVSMARILIYSLEFGPDILISSSWICLTSREMCCSRSLFCSSSWWTRAWASSRAVASALSWSFSRWTYTGQNRGFKISLANPLYDLPTNRQMRVESPLSTALAGQGLSNTICLSGKSGLNLKYWSKNTVRAMKHLKS